MAGGGGGTFRLTLSLHKEGDDAVATKQQQQQRQQQQQKASAAVYCKMDGQRFAQPKTVKLLSDCKYRIDLSIRPASIRTKVKALLLMERSLELVDTSAKNEDDDDNDDDDDGSNNGEAPVYSSHFLMDFLPPSKKGQRECLPLLIKLNGGYEFRTSLQVKVYKANSTQHCDWGTPIHSIEYECAIDQHTTTDTVSVKIVKETFR